MARLHRAWLHAIALVLLFALPSRADPSVVHDYQLSLRPGDLLGAAVVGATVTLGASVDDYTGPTCVYEGDSGMSCSKPTCPSCDCPGWKIVGGGGGRVDATIVSAACDAPACKVSFDAAQSTVAVSMDVAGMAVVTVSMRVPDGSVVAGSAKLTFDTPAAIGATRKIDSIGTMDALLVGQSFTWCASVTGQAGEQLSDTPTFSSSAELSLVAASPPCATFHATRVGRATVTEELPGLRRDFAIDVVDASSVTSLEWIDVTHLAMDLNAPPADVDTPLLSTIAPTPASGDTVRLCGAELAARFQTADGRVGVAPSASVSVKGLGTHDTGTDLIDLDPRGTTGSGTVSAVLGGARASVDVTFTDVSSCF